MSHNNLYTKIEEVSLNRINTLEKIFGEYKKLFSPYSFNIFIFLVVIIFTSISRN